MRKIDDPGDAEDQDSAYKLAMKPFSQLNARENDHPLPLVYYYRSYTERGMEPPENAKHALERAAQLAPFDKGLWFNVAVMQMQEGKIALAKQSLQPIANDPHGGGQAEHGKNIIAMLDKMDEGTKVTGRDLALSQPVETADVPVDTDAEEDDEAAEE